MKATVRGGIHPLRLSGGGKRASKDAPIQDCRPVDTVVIPMAMHLGAPSAPCVSVGEHVGLGRRIADPVGALGLPVHASVSGTVTEIAEKQQLGAKKVLCITIENDYNDEWESLEPVGCVETAEPAEMLAAIKNAGICGMGGAAFPAHIKLSCPEGKYCDTVILNGAECETHVTADDRLMREQPGRILKGLVAAMRIMGVKKGVIAIEDNKPEAIAAMRCAAEGRSGVEIRVLKTKYPQGGEKQLIKAVTGREVMSGQLPIDSHVVVLNAATSAAIADAVELGKPLVSRVTTVTGCVREPKNLLLRIGTRIEDAIGACGGFSEEPGKMILGGGMMGTSAPTDDISVLKATNGVIVFAEQPADLPDEGPCIRCGLCVDACPMGLYPYLLKNYCNKGKYGEARDNNLMDCILCGCCTYVCPAKRTLTASFRHSKEVLAARARKEKEAAGK